MKSQIILLVLVLLAKSGIGQEHERMIDFDSIGHVYIDTLNADNIWQVGQPQKTLFDSAFSAPNVIITDTVEFYPNLNHSEFIVIAPNFYGGIGMDLYHRFNTDTLADYGRIEVSYNGVDWLAIDSTTSFSQFDFYGDQSSEGFSGTSDGWVQSYAYWNYPPTDTLQIKFIFTSDDVQTNKEGWMIDNIYFTFDLGIGIEENETDDHYTIAPNPFSDQTIIKFSNPQGDIYNLQLFDYNGRMVKSIDNISSDQIRLDSDNLTNGLYLFRLTSDVERSITGRVVLKK